MSTIEEKLTNFYQPEHPFKEGVSTLRNIALESGLEETFKWSFPVYTSNGKNVIGISKFKGYFGIWFFKGSLLKDPLQVLLNAQEGKTQGMRHWKFTDVKEINKPDILAYIADAIEVEKKGLKVPKIVRKVEIETPSLLLETFASRPEIEEQYNNLTPYKQKEYNEYIATAKQDKTKRSRLEKIIPLLLEGKGLNDKYR